MAAEIRYTPPASKATTKAGEKLRKEIPERKGLVLRVEACRLHRNHESQAKLNWLTFLHCYTVQALVLAVPYADTSLCATTARWSDCGIGHGDNPRINQLSSTLGRCTCKEITPHTLSAEISRRASSVSPDSLSAASSFDTFSRLPSA